MLVVPNYAQSTLRAAITPASTSLLLAAGGGAYFNIGTGNWCYLTIEDGQSVEVVKYTNTGIIINDTLEVERAQDGTTAKAFPAGACVKVAWNVAQVQALVTQTFVNLFDAEDLPPNTIQVTAPPNTQPAHNIIYAVWVVEHRFWYWTGTSWVEIGNAADSVLTGNGPPSGTPGGNVAFYVDQSNAGLWYWTGAAWMQIAGHGSTEEYWVRGAIGNLYVLPSESQVELGVIAMTDRYRMWPNNVPSNTILQVINQGGLPRTTLLQAAAMEVIVSVRGDFGSNPVPEAIMQLVIANNYDGSFYGNASPVDADFAPDILLSASTGVLTWPAGTFFDGNLVYSRAGAGPWPDFNITQVNTEFHVVEAGVGP